jgi:hypothetical protein
MADLIDRHKRNQTSRFMSPKQILVKITEPNFQIDKSPERILVYVMEPSFQVYESRYCVQVNQYIFCSLVKHGLSVYE